MINLTVQSNKTINKVDAPEHPEYLDKSQNHAHVRVLH